MELNIPLKFNESIDLKQIAFDCLQKNNNMNNNSSSNNDFLALFIDIDKLRRSINYEKIQEAINEDMLSEHINSDLPNINRLLKYLYDIN